MTLHVAIVDDEEVARRQLRECLDFLSEKEGISVVAEEFSSGVALLDKYEPRYDVLFLDIEMPGINGLETAKSLRELDNAVMLIFVTNMAHYAVMGYEVEAFDFMVKPVSPYSFALKMKRALGRLCVKESDAVLIRHEGNLINVRSSDIRYLEAQGHYTLFHTVDATYREYCTFKEAIARLNSSKFAFCNRCYYVNMSYVRSICKDMVYLGEEGLIISRPQRRAFLAAYALYLGGKKNV